MPCASSPAVGALPQATVCQTRSTVRTGPNPGGPNKTISTDIEAQAAATTDSGSVASTALPNLNGAFTFGVRKNTPRLVKSALRQARATVKFRASITIAVSGTSRHGAPTAA